MEEISKKLFGGRPFQSNQEQVTQQDIINAYKKSGFLYHRRQIYLINVYPSSSNFRQICLVMLWTSNITYRALVLHPILIS